MDDGATTALEVYDSQRPWYGARMAMEDQNRLAEKIERFWRDQGFNKVRVQVKRKTVYLPSKIASISIAGQTHQKFYGGGARESLEIVSNLVNGLPPK